MKHIAKFNENMSIDYSITLEIPASIIERMESNGFPRDKFTQIFKSFVYERIGLEYSTEYEEFDSWMGANEDTIQDIIEY